MKQTFSIDFDGGLQNAPGVAATLNSLLLSPDNEPIIKSALVHENKEKFGPSSISGIVIDIVNFDEVKQSGRLRFWYDMQLTFGCEDFTKDHKNQHSYYNFSINSDNRSVLFTGDEQESRSTADEF